MRVDKVVQCAGQGTNVLPIEGCNEGAVERLVNAVRDVIAFMFEITETTHLAVGIGSRFDHFSQKFGHLQAVVGGIIEMHEELFVSWQEFGKHHGTRPLVWVSGR